MDAYDRCSNLGKKILPIVFAIYGQGRELFRAPTYSDFSENYCGRCSDFSLLSVISLSNNSPNTVIFSRKSAV